MSVRSWCPRRMSASSSHLVRREGLRRRSHGDTHIHDRLFIGSLAQRVRGLPRPPHVGDRRLRLDLPYRAGADGRFAKPNEHLIDRVEQRRHAITLRCGALRISIFRSASSPVGNRRHVARASFSWCAWASAACRIRCGAPPSGLMTCGWSPPSAKHCSTRHDVVGMSRDDAPPAIRRTARLLSMNPSSATVVKREP